MNPEDSTTSQPLSQASESLNSSVEPAENSGQSQAGGGFGLTNFAATQAAADAAKAQKTDIKKPFLSRRAIVIIILVVLALLTLGGIGLGVWRLYRTGQQVRERTNITDKYSQQSITIEGSNQAAIISPNSLNASQQVDVNGSLQVSGSLRLVPTTRPVNPIPGQQYIDAADNKLYLYNGSQWIAQLNVVDLNAVNANIQNLNTQNANITNQVNSNAAAVNSGTALPPTVTLQGNTFNGGNQLVQLTGGGLLPAVNGSQLTNVDAISLQGNGASYFTNASNISSGTLADGRLSGNVALLNAANVFTNSNTFNGVITTNTIQPTGAMTIGSTNQSLTLQGNGATTISATNSGFATTLGFTGSPTGNVNYNIDQNPTHGPGAYSICTSDGNCLGGGGGGANTALSNLTTTSLNQSLLPNAAGAINLGSNTLPFGQLSLAGTSLSPNVNNYLITGASTGGTRNIALPDAGGTVALGPLTVNGLLYGNGNNAAVGSVTNGTTGQCLVAQTGAAPVFGSCSGAGSGSSLQAAYDNGNTITTTPARDLSVTLANNANFSVNIASNQTGKFAVQNAGSDMLSVTTAGGILANTNINIAGKTDGNSGTDYTSYKATPQTSEPSVKLGTYVGDYTGTYGAGGCSGSSGTNTHTETFSGWGAPAVAIVMPLTHPNVSGAAPPYIQADANKPSIRITNMPSNQSRTFSADYSNQTDGIRSMWTDNVEFGCIYNKSGINYSYIVMKPSSGSGDNYFAYGSYTGNGQDDISISTGQSWAPDSVMVIKATPASGESPLWRSSDMPNDAAIRFANPNAAAGHAVLSNTIQSFATGNFQVGSSNMANQFGHTYYWFAFKKFSSTFDVTSYIGNAAIGQQISLNTPFQPDFTWLKADYQDGGNPNTYQGMYRTSAFASNNSIFVNGNNSINDIVSFGANYFQLRQIAANNHSNVDLGNDGNGDPYKYFSASYASHTNTSQVNGYSASATYNGKLYLATKINDGCEIYRYDGGSTFTKISGSGGMIMNGDSQAVDSISSMKVYDGKLMIATKTNDDNTVSGTKGLATVYSYSGPPAEGSYNLNSWSKANSAQGTFGAVTSVDNVNSMAVVNNILYASIGTSGSAIARIFRYDNGTTWTEISNAAGKIISGDAGDIESINLINYQGRLYAGSETDAAGHAGLYVWDGNAWALVNQTRGSFGSTSSINGISAMTIFNNNLIIGTNKTSSAEIYKYDGPSGGAAGSSGGGFIPISNSAGNIMGGGSYSGVNKIGSLTVFNGYLLAGSYSSGKGSIYRYAGNSTANINNWTLFCSTGGCPTTPGTMAGQASIDGIMFMINYNGTLFAGSDQSQAGQVYTYARNDGMSYALNFNAGTTAAGFDNIGSFAFEAGNQANSAGNNTGQFLLSHSLATTAGAYDIAEDYQTSDDDLVAGDVVAIDPARSNGFVRRADLSKGDGPRLLGIVSTHPAFRLSQRDNYNAAAGSRTVPIALAGRVPVKIDPDSDSIAPGDYLTAGTKPGMAIKTTQTGAVIAKALEGWQKGSGKATVEVFVSNTFLLPGGQALSTQSTTEQIISSGKPITIFDAFLATADNSLQVLKDLNIFGNTFFKGNTDFAGRQTYHDKDSAGHAVLHKDQQQIDIKFDKPYEQTPVISVTPLSFIRFKIINKTKNGFTIQVQDEIQDKVEFDWTAVYLIDPKTFENLTPTPSTN